MRYKYVWFLLFTCLPAFQSQAYSSNPVVQGLSSGLPPAQAIRETYAKLAPLPLSETLEAAFASGLSVKEVVESALSIGSSAKHALIECFIAGTKRQSDLSQIALEASLLGVPEAVITEALAEVVGATAAGEQIARANIPSSAGQSGNSSLVETVPNAIEQPPEVIPPPPATEGDGRISPDSPTNLTSTGLL